MQANTLYLGDNLTLLRESFEDACVDLIYLDPPFNSKRNYSWSADALVRIEREKKADEGVRAPTNERSRVFSDTWSFEDATEAFEEIAATEEPLARLFLGLREAFGETALLGYLSVMALRLRELHRALKPTGALYLHCDPRASHYLKMTLDAIFGPGCFRNEIIWHYGGRGAKAVALQFGRNHDVILFFTKGPKGHAFTRQYAERRMTGEEAAARGYRRDEQGRWFKTAPRGDYTDESLRRLEAEGRLHRTKTDSVRVKYLLREEEGRVVEDILLGDTWTDLPDAMHLGKERQGFPTQKPLALLERIVSASSAEGEVVLDPFCGSGTTLVAAHRLGRRWCGIDLAPVAIELTRQRLAELSSLEFAASGGVPVVGP